MYWNLWTWNYVLVEFFSVNFGQATTQWDEEIVWYSVILKSENNLWNSLTLD